MPHLLCYQCKFKVSHMCVLYCNTTVTQKLKKYQYG